MKINGTFAVTGIDRAQGQYQVASCEDNSSRRRTRRTKNILRVALMSIFASVGKVNILGHLALSPLHSQYVTNIKVGQAFVSRLRFDQMLVN